MTMPGTQTPQYQHGAPVLLQDSALLDLTLAAGIVKQLSSQKLSNVYGTAMAVTQIDFYVQTFPVNTPNATVGNGSEFDFGSIITARVGANNVNLMQNPVHLRSLGTLYQTDLQFAFQRLAVDATFFLYHTTHYRWVLPHPMYLPRNASLDIQVAADAIASRPWNSSAIIPQAKVSVAVHGTLQPDANAMMAPYPYVAEFAPPGISVLTSTGKPAFAMGNDPVFRNPFMNPLLLQKIVASNYNGTITTMTQAQDRVGLDPSVVTSRIWDSRGNNIAGYGGGDAIPLGLLVDPRTGEWNLERQLDAYQWLNVELFAVTSADYGTQPVWFPRIAIHGTHMELFQP